MTIVQTFITCCASGGPHAQKLTDACDGQNCGVRTKYIYIYIQPGVLSGIKDNQSDCRTTGQIDRYIDVYVFDGRLPRIEL